MNEKYRRLCESTLRLDMAAKALLDSGRLKVDIETGLVFATESKTPEKPIGTPNRGGYLRTCVTNLGKAVTLMVHRIVWISAHGVPALGAKINHKSGLKTDNRLSNLEAVTAAENNEHARVTGLWVPNRGTKNGFGKLTDEQVMAIRSDRAGGASAEALSKAYGITASYVRRVVSRKARP